MTAWLGAAALAVRLGVAERQAQRIIAAGVYDGVALETRREKITGGKGRPTTLVLWDTEANRPGRTAAGETAMPDKTAEAVLLQAGPTDGAGAAALVPDLSCAGGDTPAPPAPCHVFEGYGEVVDMGTGEIIGAAAAGETATPVLLETHPTEALDMATGETVHDFETLLYRKLAGRPKNVQRAQRAYYTRQHRETGVIPAALLVDDGRRYSGKKSSLDKAIQNRFIDMVVKSADAADIFHYHTQNQRKVTVFHAHLEQEFGRKIPIAQLYAVSRASGLRRYLELPDDEDDTAKTPGYFKAEPVGALVQMDGVEADYLEIRVDGKWKKPVWIELMDLGSRKILAMHAYLNEGSHAACDIFARFLADNRFAKRPMKIRPDQAGGFRNLRRPIKELNNRHARPGGFVFLDDFSRPGTPKDKAHLESSHRALHKILERGIINHFKDRIDSQYKKQKKAGHNLRAVTVTRLNISLDELNQCGQTEAYLQRHNGGRHRFTEDGVQRTWVPDQRWQAHLDGCDHFAFGPEDIACCKIYGYEKTKATIAKDGTITYQRQKYYVEDTSLWSRGSSTDVKISLVDGALAIFKHDDEGVHKGTAKPLEAPVKPEKLVQKEKAKVEKIHADSEQHGIIALLKHAGMIVNEDLVKRFIAEGLTLAVTCELLEENRASYAQRPGTIVPFHLFSSDWRRRLAERGAPSVKPYALKQ